MKASSSPQEPLCEHARLAVTSLVSGLLLVLYWLALTGSTMVAAAAANNPVLQSCCNPPSRQPEVDSATQCCSAQPLPVCVHPQQLAALQPMNGFAHQ
jgi:hypothetical protein